MNNDHITAVFSVVGTIVIARSALLLARQKSVRGVSLWQAVFFATWGVWNLFFYDAIGLYWSWYGAVGIAVTNCTWTAMLCWFKFKEWCEELQAAFDEDIERWRTEDKFYREDFPEEKDQ